MIELVDKLPDINVQAAEYARLLGYPRGWVLEGRARELAAWARQWFAQHGRPWIYARRSRSAELIEGGVVVDGEAFACPPLADQLRQAQADSVALVAVSGGPEIEAQARQAWLDEKPDEYFFLEVYGSAVVEHLTTMAGAHLCAWAEGHGLAVLPHYSPGYPLWDAAEQPRLLELIKHNGRKPFPSALDALESGMLRPKKSLLAVFGLTRQTERVRRVNELVPCENCSFNSCQYRRAPYRGPSQFSTREFSRSVKAADVEVAPLGAPLDLAAQYTVNVKALERWARDRLSLERRPDGTVLARFRYEGTTCTNMGRPLAFDYTVRLGERRAGYPIVDESCAPAPDDEGHRFMCRYLDEGDQLLARIAGERPLAGARLDDIASWRRPVCAAGCYCDAESRQHKWGLVLETIHYALAQQERQNATARLQETEVR